MKRILILLCLVFVSASSFSQEFPQKATTLVSDYTNTLSASQIAQLESKLVAFDDSTSNQIAVVIIKSVGDYDINEYALNLGRKWGIGGKGKNNGVILLVALGDRKLSIQTGYGLEGALPDIYTKRIIENDIKPFFKEGDYYGGINAGTNSIISLVKGEYKNDAKRKTGASGGAGSALAVIVMIIIVIILLKRGGGGGGNQVIGSRGASDALFWALLFGSGRGGNGGGGFGGGFGGGSSGGGFGGFGGGSFGGGGSSGSW